jgi:hypothetical protein
VGVEHGANITTALHTIFVERKFRRTLENYNIIYYITEYMHPQISIFRNTAVTNITKYQTYVIHVCTVGQ